MSQNYQYTISAGVSAADAYRKVARVSDWWNKAATGKAQESGDRFRVDFGSTWVAFKVIEAVPNRRLVWSVEDCHLHWLEDKTEWKGTEVVWDIAAVDGVAEVKMTHVGLTPEVECFGACEAGWNFHVGKSLLKLLTEGHGLPANGKEN